MFQVCLVMELAKGGEVFDKLLEFGSLPEPVAAKLMYQVKILDYWNIVLDYWDVV